METQHPTPQPNENFRPDPLPIIPDDPQPAGWRHLPDAHGVPQPGVTMVAVFEEITGARSCADDLEHRGIAVGLVSTRGEIPEQSGRPVQSSPPQAQGGDKLGAGVTMGATIGATAGLVAANWLLPGLGLVATGSLVSTLAGAGIGSMLGGIFSPDRGGQAAAKAAQGGVILLARVPGEQADEIRRLISVWHPLELRVQ